MAEIKKQELDFGPRVEGIANPDLELLPTLNEDEDLIKRLSQRDVSAPQIRQPEELNMNRVEGAPPPSTTSEMADRIEVLLEGERRRKGRKPQSIMLGDPVPLSPWAKQTQQQGPLIGAPAATGFGVLADSGDLGPLDPQKIIQSQAKIPLAPGVDPSVLKEKDEPQPATGFGVLKTSGQLGPLDPIDLLQDIDDNLKYPIPMQRPDRAKGIGDIAADPDFDKLIADDVAAPRGTKKDLVKETEKALSFPDLGPGLQAPSMLGPVDDRTEDEINQDIIKDATKSFEDPGAKIDAQRSIASGDASAENMIAQALIGLGPAILGGIGSGELGAQAGLKRGDELEKLRRKDLEAQRKAEAELMKEKAKSQADIQKALAVEGIKGKYDILGKRVTGEEARKKLTQEQVFDWEIKKLERELEQKKLGSNERIALAERIAKKEAENVKNVKDLFDKHTKNKITIDTGRVLTAWNGLVQEIEDEGGLEAYINGTGTKQKGVGDISLINRFIKSVDPGTAVRDSETKLLLSSIPALQKIGLIVKKNFDPNTGLLTKEAREQVIEQIRSYKDAQLKTQSGVDAGYTAVAKRAGVDPKLITGHLPQARHLGGGGGQSAPGPGSMAFSDWKKEKEKEGR